MVSIKHQSAEILFAPSLQTALELIYQAKSTVNVNGNKSARSQADMFKSALTLANLGHFSVFEHVNVSLRLQTDIGCYKALTRHRHCAFTIESTLYSKYGADSISFIEAVAAPFSAEQIEYLSKAVSFYISEYATYKDTVKCRDFLPQCTGALVVLTTNIRELAYICKLRMTSYKGESVKIKELCTLIDRLMTDRYDSLWSTLYETTTLRSSAI